MSDAPIQITAHGDGWRNVEYIRADVAHAQVAVFEAQLAQMEKTMAEIRSMWGRVMDEEDARIAAAEDTAAQAIRVAADLRKQLTAANKRSFDLIGYMEDTYFPRHFKYHSVTGDCILAYHVVKKEWYKVHWSKEIAENRAEQYSHWMHIPPHPVTPVTP